MGPLEVIDLSSDDEKSPPKKQNHVLSVKENKVEEAELEIVYNAIKNRKLKRSIDKIDESSSKAKRRKLSKNEGLGQSDIVANLIHEKSEISLHRIRKIKPQTISSQCTAELFTPKSIAESKDDSFLSLKTKENADNLVENIWNVGDKVESPNSRNDTHLFKINEGASSSTQIIKPHLTVRKTVKVSETMDTNLGPSTEVVESFLEACRSQDSSRDMEKIITKLRKRYQNLQPSYAKSGSFIELIRNKRNLILNNGAKLYLHISEVMAEMKARQLEKRSSIQAEGKFDIKPETTPTQPRLSNIPEGCSEPDQDVLVIEDSRDSQRLQLLEKAMRRCARRINKCETAEVNFDDENDSHYIMAEKYKTRMVELYNKYCEITGENPDAARPYLRPKCLAVTPIPSLNNALTSFINMKITKMNGRLVHIKKNAVQHRFTDALIFPDFVDILNCVKKCNEEENLQLNKAKQESIAKEAFDKLGKHLKHCRQMDYYDTFSLYLEKEVCGDPALSDKILAEKLNTNQEIGKKKMDQVFQEFAEREDAANAAQNGSCLNKENDVQTGDESSEDSTDQNSTVSEIEDTGNKCGNDFNEGQDNNVIIEPQDDLNEKREKDINPIKPEGNLEQKGNEIVEPDKPKIDLNTKGDKRIKVDEAQDDLNKNDNKDVELDKHMDTNEEISIKPRLNDGLDSISVEKIDENSIEIDASEPIASKVENKVLVKEEQKTEIRPEQDLVQQTEITRGIRQISIDQETKKTANVVEISKSSSPIKESAATVATCKVNLMQAVEILKMNLSDDCLPVVPENTTKVIDASTLATTVELINEEETKKPILRLRQFAKPPGSWKDFQSPTKNLNQNIPQIDETANADTETKKSNDTLSGEDKMRKCIKINQPTTFGRTVQLKNDVILNLKNKKSTVIIPPSPNRSSPQINVNSVTNNVTFNFNNPGQFQPRVSSQISQELNGAPKNLVNINRSGNIVAHCSNVRVIKINSVKNTLHPTQTVQTDKQQQLPIQIPAGQVRLNGQQAPVIVPQPHQIEKTTVRDIPFINRNGKRSVFRLVKCPSGFNVQNSNVPERVAGDAADVRNRTTNSPNQICNSITDADRRLNPKLTNSIRNLTPLKIPRQPSDKVDKVNKVNEAPVDSAPTYVIE